MSTLDIPVQHLRSFTAGHVPTSAQLLQGQIAINIVDKKIYTLDNTGTVQQIGVALSQLATVATSGSYNDLTNKPNIQAQYQLPVSTSSVLGGVLVPASGGIAVDSNGNITNAGVLSVNSRTGAVTLTATDVGLPTDLLSGPSTTIATKYLPTAIAGGLSYQGIWNASTNSPTLANGGVGPGGTQLANGDYYVVNVAGSTSIDGISTWNLGDLAVVSNGVWTRIANSGTTVTSVAGRTGAITLAYTDISGLATVAHSGSYTDLTNKPTAYSLPIATTTTLGGVILNTTAQQPGNTTTGQLATVATSGSYNDLLNLPVNPAVARINANLQGNPTVLTEVFYIFTGGCQFPQNFASSEVFAVLQSGTTATVRIMQYPAATPTTGTQIGTINIDTQNGNTFTSTGSTTTYNLGDQLSYQFATTNITRMSVGLRGTWTS
jgi:hypothetical protein